MECTKVKFSDEAQALFYIDKLKKTSKRIKIPKRAYLCQYCLSYHLTHKDLIPEPIPIGLKQQIEYLTEAIKKRNLRIDTLKQTVIDLKIKLNEQSNLIHHLKGNL